MKDRGLLLLHRPRHLTLLLLLPLLLPLPLPLASPCLGCASLFPASIQSSSIPLWRNSDSWREIKRKDEGEGNEKRGRRRHSSFNYWWEECLDGAHQAL